jgi:hypothetical protein
MDYGQPGRFFWRANKDSNRPQPYVKAIVVDTTNWTVINEPDIWHPDFAWAYPAACPNGSGFIGISLFKGGGASHPSHSCRLP